MPRKEIDTLDKAIPSVLLDALKASRCVLFIGAGVSAGPGGLPSGTELAHRLAQHGGLCNCQHLGGPSDCDGARCCCRWSLQRMAQYYELEHSEYALNSFLKDTIDAVREPLPTHKAIARLHTKFAAIVTTNYDQLLESAFKEIGIELASVVVERDLPYVGNKSVLIKMHGCISNFDSIVITENDYVHSTFFTKRPLIANKLKGYLADHVVLFLGYSLEDDTFRSLYYDVARSLDQHKIPAFAVQRMPIHFEIEHWKRHNVTILDYDALAFLEQVETELTSDIDDLLALLERAVQAFQTKGDVLGKHDWEIVNERLDILMRRSALTLEMKEVLARSAMYREQSPSWWLELTDSSTLRMIAAEYLEVDHSQAQENAALLAGELELESAMPQLLQALGSRDLKVRDAASWALTSIGTRTVAEALLQQSQDEQRADAALETFFNLPADVAVEVFVTCFSKMTIAEQSTILKQLSELLRKDSERWSDPSKETLVECASIALENHEEEIFDIAIELLERIELESAAKCLGEFALSEKSEKWRCQKAVRALGDQRTQWALDYLGKFSSANVQASDMLAKSPFGESEWEKQRLKADVLLVTVTEVETLAVLDLVQERFGHEYKTEHTDPEIYYDLGTIGKARTVMVRSEMGTGGPGGSTMTISESIKELSPSAAIMVGIAFGLNPKEQQIGDVLISEQLLGYEFQRVGSGTENELEIRLRAARPEVPLRLLKRFRHDALRWKEAKVRFGLVLSGEKLVDHLGFRDQLYKLAPTAMGGEMEGWGLYSAAHRHDVDWILVKAICDWADGKKHENESQHQEKAARNAASFVIHVLEQGRVKKDGKPSSFQHPGYTQEPFPSERPLSNYNVGNLYESAIEALRDILSLYRHRTVEDEPIRQRAVDILVRAGDKSPRTLKLLDELVIRDEDEIRKKVLQNLERFYGLDKLVTIHQDILRSRRRRNAKDNKIRLAAAEKLIKTGNKSPDTQILFQERIRDEDEWLQVRVTLLQNLHQFCKSEDLVTFFRDVATLSGLPTSDNGRIRLIAVERLVESEDKSPETLALFRNLSKDRDKTISLNAVTTLIESGDRSPETLALFEDLYTGDDERIRTLVQGLVDFEPR